MKILQIDDNETITKTFSKILKMHGYDYTVASDGKTGLELILKEKFDCIFLDLTMPNFSGYDVLDELKKQSISDNHIIALTATTLTDDQKNQLLDKGVKLILHKPIGLDEVINVLEKFKLEIEAS